MRVTRYVLLALLLAGLYAVAAQLGIAIATTYAPVTAVWLPSGVAVAGLLLWGRGMWPAVALGSVVATVTTGGSLRTGLAIAAGPAAEAWLAALLFTLASPRSRHDFDRVRDVVALTVAAFVTPVAAATHGTTVLCWLGRLPWSAYAGAWATWWAGNALGILLVTPVWLTWRAGARLRRRPARLLEAGLVLLGAFGLSWVAFTGPLPAAFLLAPLLTVTAIRFGPRGAATSLLVASTVIIWMTFRGAGPFATSPLDEGLLALQIFLAVCTITILALAAASAERDQVQAALRDARDELERRVAERTERLRQTNERLAEELRERLRAEDERRHLETQVRQSQKLESLGLLAGGIAHDFNNLLTAILGHADLARADLPEQSPVRGHIDEINVASHRAAELAGQMLAYSGRAQLAKAPVQLSDIVCELGPLLQASIPKKVTLDFTCVQDLPLIQADATQLRQVVMNLIINASEAIGDAAGSVTVATRVVTVPEALPAGAWIGGPPPPGRYVLIDVTDSGCGMDADTLSRVFDPFFTTKVSGRGLGLAVVVGIVRGHGGHLAVDTAPTRGTTFSILFPPAAVQIAAPAPVSPALPSTAWSGHGTILIADDEPAVLRLARTMVERCGFETLLAEDGEEAVRLYRAHADRVVAVLLDLSMPRMGGREALAALRQIDAALPVILSSGYPEQDAVPGATAFIQKPYRLAALRETLRAAVDHQAAAG